MLSMSTSNAVTAPQIAWRQFSPDWQPIRIQLAGVLALPLLLMACSSLVPATVTQAPTVILSKEQTMLLSAGRQRPRIAQSLRDAGVTVVAETSNANYSLHVDVGRHRSNRSCGAMNNVRYMLLQAGVRLIVIKGRGWTGSCSPNIFDDMSRTLASYFSPAQDGD